MTIETPRFELPETRRAEFERERAELSARKSSRDSWRTHAERRRLASVRDGVDQSIILLTLQEDDPDHLAFTITDDGERWTIDVDIRHRRLPRLDLVGRADLTRIIREAGAPGCLARFLGGHGDGRAAIDLTTLEGRGGALFDGQGTANRFRGAGRADIETSVARWTIDGVVTARARGLGRLVLLALGRRIRRQITDGLEDFWRSSDDRIAQVEADLRDLGTRVEREGGEAAFVHRALWDRDFDARPPRAHP